MPRTTAEPFDLHRSIAAANAVVGRAEECIVRVTEHLKDADALVSRVREQLDHVERARRSSTDLASPSKTRE